MGLKIGDTITVNIVGRDIDLKIFNLRDIDFRTGGMKFIFMVSPGVVDQAPHTFLSTVRAAPAQEEAMFSAVSKAFPNITVVRVRDALSQVGELLEALARGIEIASLVTVLAGVLVLAGAIAAGHRARLYDAVILKVLGRHAGAARARLHHRIRHPGLARRRRRADGRHACRVVRRQMGARDSVRVRRPQRSVHDCGRRARYAPARPFRRLWRAFCQTRQAFAQPLTAFHHLRTSGACALMFGAQSPILGAVLGDRRFLEIRHYG
jgi:hypothetical protein